MEKDFLPHLNVQTNSNFSFSFLTIPQLVDFWEKLTEKKTLNYLAIADYYPFEIINFFQLCKEKKIQPVWGVKIFFQKTSQEKKYSATIYPQTNQACKEIIAKLFSSTSPLDRTFVWDFVLNFSNKNCLIVLEAQQSEDIDYFIHLLTPIIPQKNTKIFIGLNFFLSKPSLSLPPKINSLLLPFFSIKVLTNEEVKLLNLWKKTTFSRNFFPADSHVNFLSYCNTYEYFSHCTDESTFYQLLLLRWQTFLTKINLNPNFFPKKPRKIKKENPSLLTLKSKCWETLLSSPSLQSDNYQKTLEKELEVIEKLDYVEYFLLFSEVVDYLRNKGVTIGPGRGSAVSSLVAYLLKITSIDPLKHNLFFERFLNEKRKSAPDIDLDVENQEEVFNYLQKNYSLEQVSRISIRKKIGWKNSCLESAKFWQIGEIELKEIISSFSKNPNFDNLKLQQQKLHYPLFFALVEKIQDLYYEISVHPSGIIVAEHSLVGLVPLKREKNICLTLFEEEQLTKLGLKKYDFLSLKKSFSFVDDIKSLNFLSEVKGLTQIKLPSYQEINLADNKTWVLLTNLCLTGIFQLDTPSARNLFSQFNPQNFSELILFLALNRPGARKRAEQIIIRKNNQEKIFFGSPILQKILTETYGLIVFEEQISQIFSFIFNCSFAEAEIKRQELKEKGPEKDFFTYARKKLSQSDSKLIYQQIFSLRGYTFNKAHAVAYGYLTYYISYLKANFFSELITYFLNEKKEKNPTYLQEAFFHGFQIEMPNINYSQIDWSQKGKKLIMGFSGLKKYQAEFFSALIDERKKNGVYHNWENFLLRTSEFWKKVEQDNLLEWAKGGLFSSFGVDVETLQENCGAIFRYLHLRQKIPTVNDNNLPFLDLPLNLGKNESKNIINQREWESLGCYISYYSRWRELAQRKELELTSLLEVFQKHNNQELLVNIYVIINQIEKENEEKWTLLLQDVRSSFKSGLNASYYQKNKEIFTAHNELLLTCQVKIVNKKIDSINIKNLMTDYE